MAKYTATKENTDILASCLEPFDTYKEEWQYIDKYIGG